MSGSNGIDSLIPPLDGVVPHIYTVVLNRKINRDQVRDILLENQIETGVHYIPNHLHSLYKTNVELPITCEFHQSLLTLPLHADLSISDVEYITTNLLDAIS